VEIIRDATEDEMVLDFLKAEIDSPHYGPCLEPFRDVIESADLTNEAANTGLARGRLRSCAG
jgi:hypothetical protein